MIHMHLSFHNILLENCNNLNFLYFTLAVMLNRACALPHKEGPEIQETSAQINMPLLQSSCCFEPKDRCHGSPQQREHTRSNHERCKNHRPSSTPVSKSEPSLVRSNNSCSCLYFSSKPTAV